MLSDILDDFKYLLLQLFLVHVTLHLEVFTDPLLYFVDQPLSALLGSGQPNLVHDLHHGLHRELLVNPLLLQPVLLYNYGPNTFHNSFKLWYVQFLHH